jgi:hypothetical protein
LVPEEGIARIPLCDKDDTTRAHAIMDIERAEWASQWRWHLSAHGYAARNVVGGEGAIYLHRELLGLTPGDGLEGDHLNKNRLDDRLENLRVVPKLGNRQNVPARKGASSRFRGVTWHKQRGKWAARVNLSNSGGKNVYLGLFENEEAAASAAREARARLMPFSVD